MSIAKELVRCFPEHWEADIYTHEIYLMPGSDAPFSSIAIDGESESPGFINWALDELAKKNLTLVPFQQGKFWYVDGCPGHQHPTKTLALAHALIALGENDG